MSVLCVLTLLLGAAGQSYDVRGRIEDSGQQPISGAPVWLVHQQQVLEATTGDNGDFTIANVPPGPVTVIARKDGLALDGLTAQLVGDAEVLLRLGQADDVKVRVIDSAFQPISGVWLKRMTVCGAFDVPVDLLASLGFGSLRSDSDGRVAITNIPKGGYVQFTLSHPRHAPTTITYLAAGRPEQVVTMEPGELVAGRITNEEGQAIAGAHVAVLVATSQGIQPVDEVLSDPEGFFSVRAASDEVFVLVEHADYAPSRPVVATLWDDAVRPIDVILQAPCFVDGSIVGQDEKPAPAVGVSYLRQGLILTRAWTDVNGSFRLKVAPGKGELLFFAPAGTMVEGLNRLPIDTQDGDELTIEPLHLVPLPNLEGVVSDADGEPSTGVRVALQGLERLYATTTRDDGSFSLPLDTIPHTPTLSLLAEHPLRFQRRQVDFPLDALQAISIQLQSYEPDLTPVRDGYEWNDLSLLRDKPAPPWSCGQWWNGAPVELADLKGRVVVLTLWGGFAAAGRQHIETLNQLHSLYEVVDDVAFIGIHDNSLDEKDIEMYIKEYGITYPVGRDQEPAVTFSRYNTTIIPQTVLIDRHGVLRYYDVQGRIMELIKVLRREI